jgi:hypothetical protein
MGTEFRIPTAYENCNDSVKVNDRRHTRVTIQDLRRDLRQADEDRFRLTMQASDLRHPRVGVQDLRRHLREADEDRFRLTMRLRSQATLLKRGRMVMLLLLIAGSGIAFSVIEHPAPAPPSGPKKAIPATRVGVLSGVRSVEILPPPSIAAETPDPAPVIQTRRRPAAKGPDRLIPAQSPAPRRSVTPRPLHPGEFGRKSGDALSAMPARASHL